VVERAVGIGPRKKESDVRVAEESLGLFEVGIDDGPSNVVNLMRQEGEDLRICRLVHADPTSSK
jgi:hypothetical protein